MDFSLSDEHEALLRNVRDFATREVRPLAAELDREARFPAELVRRMAELGLMGIEVPPELDGSGLDPIAYVLAMEEVSAACASTGVTLSVHNSLIGTPILKFGSEEQKRAWLPRLATGEVLGCYCLTEPNAGSDSAAIATSATRDGDGWVLNGTKIWVTNGGLAGLAVVYARTNPDAPKAKGISAFLVPMDTPGVKVGKHEKKTGIRASSTTEVELDGARLPQDALLGELDGGFKIAMDTLDGGRIGIASQSVGIGRACLEASLKYAGEREQFGKPLGRFQAIQWKLADMATRLDAARLLTHRAAKKRDAGERCSLQAAQAKLFASQTANFCADECLQIHGGAGYTDDFEVERLFRDARITEIYEGASDIQRIVISRALLT